MFNHRRVRRLLLFCGLSLGLGIFLITTDPTNLPIALLILPALLVFFAVFTGTLLVCDVFRIFASKKRKQRGVAAMMATLLTIGVILGSSGAIIASDILLIGLILFVALIYISNF